MVPASSSEASAKPLQLHPPEITREVDVGGSVEAIVLCPESPDEEYVKGKAIASEETTDSSCKGGSLLVKKSPSCEETANKGDINGSRDVTVPLHREVCKEKGEAEEIVNEGHLEGSMPVTEVSEKKGKAQQIVNEVNMEGVIFEGELSKEQGRPRQKLFLNVKMA